ncbi:MAG: transcriptional regulator, partial [Comamonadaceae bacterium]
MRAGDPLALPPSRKVRALLAVLAMASRPATRSRLCELLFDLPSDPRGELRWCLSRLRTVLDAPDRARVVTEGDSVALDLSDCSVDALELQQALRQGLAGLPAERLRQLAALFRSHDFAEG